MNVQECENILFSVAAVKLPSKIRVGEPPDEVDRAAGVRDEGDLIPMPPRKKIEELESYLLLTAEARQEACEARLYMQAAVRDLKRQFRELTGWEEHLAGVKKPTETAKREAKRKVNPDLYESIESGDWLIGRLSEQISRLQHDDDVVSRAYTFVTGG